MVLLIENYLLWSFRDHCLLFFYCLKSRHRSLSWSESLLLPPSLTCCYLSVHCMSCQDLKFGVGGIRKPLCVFVIAEMFKTVKQMETYTQWNVKDWLPSENKRLSTWQTKRLILGVACSRAGRCLNLSVLQDIGTVITDPPTISSPTLMSGLLWRIKLGLMLIFC